MNKSIVLPKISVVIPTCDRGEMILTSVLSVLSQSFKSHEIILVDNGVESVRVPEYILDKIKIIRSAPRVGASKARNIGAAAAVGDYIAFLDDDDIWDEHYLLEVSKLIERKKAEVIVGQLKKKHINNEIKSYKLFPSDKFLQRGAYFNNPGFGGQNITIKKTLFSDLNGFDVEMPASEDRDLAVRILQKNIDIFVAKDAISILCDHDGDRVRESLLKGNKMFIKKHWGFMSYGEKYLVLKIYLKRYIKNKIFNIKLG